MTNITIYSTTTCAYCKMLKGYLQSKDIAFEDKQADLEPKYAHELYEQSGQLGVPFTIIKNDDGSEEKILGFDRSRIDAALGIA